MDSSWITQQSNKSDTLLNGEAFIWNKTCKYARQIARGSSEKKLSGKLQLMAGLKRSSSSFEGKRERRSGWIKLWPQVELLSKCVWRQSDGPCLLAMGFESTSLFIDAVLSELFFPGILERSGCGLNTASEKGFFSTFAQAVWFYSDRYEVRPVPFVNCIYCLVWFKVQLDS